MGQFRLGVTFFNNTIVTITNKFVPDRIDWSLDDLSMILI